VCPASFKFRFPGFSVPTSGFSTLLADLSCFVSLSFVCSLMAPRSLKFGATPSVTLDDKEFSDTEGVFSMSDFIVDGSDSKDGGWGFFFCSYRRWEIAFLPRKSQWQRRFQCWILMEW
jgi:hypothetical protein